MRTHSVCALSPATGRLPQCGILVLLYIYIKYIPCVFYVGNKIVVLQMSMCVGLSGTIPSQVFYHFITVCVDNDFNIQIKICAEYRDMLPRPRLVCQEPGLRPIGRSPGVPDKSSRGLGSMSRYSAQILICFIAYIFLFFFIPLWVWLGTLQDCQYAQCHLPLSIVIRMRLVFRQSKLPACLAEVQLADQNTLRQSQSGENDR